jgi:dTDP-4-dehydrorhamnose 3,5-epimerase
MKVTPTQIPDILLIEPEIYQDNRGVFFESYNEKVFQQNLRNPVKFVQDNHSISKQNVLRGLHYQIKQSQGKLVRTVVGNIFDVAVDLRKSSPTFGQSIGYYLSAENRLQMWIPPGFAHGFLVVSETAEVLYKTTDYYAPQYQRCLLWNDPEININWNCKQPPILSPKDQTGDLFKNADVFP